MMYLLHRGFVVPETVSLIARDSDLIYGTADPALAHYAIRSEAYIRQLCRLVRQLITERPPSKPILIVPSFFAGRTVKSL